MNADQIRTYRLYQRRLITKTDAVGKSRSESMLKVLDTIRLSYVIFIIIPVRGIFSGHGVYSVCR